MKDYYIGLDIGTDSIGWAATDTQYELLKFKGNATWGIRLLEKSNTADERRAFRTARRRTQRSKFRMQCLEMLFNEEIAKVDIAFFQRLHDSSFHLEDKSVQGKYSLFNDPDYTDADYHTQYPTIYHLRRELLNNKDAHDVRLVYLALAHIIKHRGHFLFDSETLGADGMPVFADVWNELCAYVADELSVQFNCVDMTELQDILKSKKMNITKKKEALAKLFAVSKKDEPQYSILSLMAGATVQSASLFQDEDLKNTDAAKIVFNNGFDDKAGEYQSVLGDRFVLLERMKAVYDWAVLADILQGEQYLSYAKCEIYEKHKSDLQLLKEYVKAYAPNKYREIFNTNKKGLNNYLAYSGHISKGSVESLCLQADFLDYLKKQLPVEPADDKYFSLYEDIRNGALLPKAVTKDNSVIPMQVQLVELKKILQNASDYLPFLTQKDESGRTVADKIIDIFTFRIPYYVGPLNVHSDKAWLQRKDGKIYPWNFTEIVDVDRSAEKFIENLTAKCTYLTREDVLPKHSILYSVFAVLNELNNLKLDGNDISVELKQKIYHDLFMQRSKVTQKALKAYLKKYHGIDSVEITGIDGDFKNSLKSLQDLDGYDLSASEKEEIIRAITIFGDDKKLLKKRITVLFGKKLTEEQIKRIVKLKYTGWGRLSRKFLIDLPSVCEQTGEFDTIIGFMWSTNNNLMQLLSEKYRFLDAIKEENGESGFTSLRKEVEDLYVSPKVKRPIYQAMQIVEELVKIFGHEPKKIFIEVARGEEEKKRTVSRKDKLIEIYKGCKKGNEELFAALSDYDNNEFRRDALYLYFTQMGRCMYTGEVIPVESIFDRNLYDIDHIYPQSKIKDDSLDNRVLVKKTVNEEKTNIYPIAASIRADRKDFWKMLLEKGLISKVKFDRLVRNTPLTDDELSAFIGRQLVETRQSTKAVAQLLNKRYQSEIVYVKASLASEFRQKYKFVKCRTVNDYHHAKDAYLNIVVGNVHNVRFNHGKAVFVRGLQSGKYSMNAMYDRNIDGAWTVDGEHKSIDTVRKVMSKNNIRFTRYSYKQKGGLFDQQILKKGNGQVSIKKNSPLADISKYGGYNKATSTFFALAQFADKKGEQIKAIVPVDLYRETEYWLNPSAYVCEFLEVPKAQVLIPCIKYNTLISVNGFRMHISRKKNGGKVIGCKPAMQLVLDKKHADYIKYITNYLDKCTELRTVKEITPWDHLSAEENIALYDALFEKLTNSIYNVKFGKLANTLSAKKDKFVLLSVYEQCTVLMQILNILHCNVLTGDLSLLGEGKNSGETTIGNKIAKSSTMQSFKIIHQSITGLFEQEIELL
ncbi:MAG: type II CRISPR RNA-guided endonuclease Cas9 [Clostridia bacterium]|nr:type II CRISPR RNA-guided endonuclease Cas9 [Clostridia bacterium]